MHIEFDASTRENSRSPSLNNFLEKVLTTTALYGNLKKAYLHIQIKKKELDPLRLHWVQKDDHNQNM